jgi:hypothetical protein
MGNVALMTMMTVFIIIAVLVLASLISNCCPQIAAWIATLIPLFLLIGTSAYWLSAVILITAVWILARVGRWMFT